MNKNNFTSAVNEQVASIAGPVAGLSEDSTQCLDITRLTMESSGTFLKSATTSDWDIPSTQTSLTSRRRSPGFKEPSSIAAPKNQKQEL